MEDIDIAKGWRERGRGNEEVSRGIPMGRRAWVVQEGDIDIAKGCRGRSRVKEEVRRGPTCQEGMDCREKDIEMVEGWSGRSRVKEELAVA
jgi:hypothetical protein